MMPIQFQAWKDKNGRIHETAEEALKADQSHDLYVLFRQPGRIGHSSGMNVDTILNNKDEVIKILLRTI